MKHISATRITNDAFGRYGSTASLPAGAPLAQNDTFAYWSDVARFEVSGQTEIGYCTVYRQKRRVVDWMERHERTTEVLIPIDDAFILPVMGTDGNVEAFVAEPGEAVIIGPGIWHSACKPVDGDEATYLVVFRRGTPHEDVIKTEIEPVTIDWK